MINFNRIEQNRTSNIELLRIISMLFIVMHHFSVHSGIPFGKGPFFNDVFLQGFEFGGKVGVDVFALISGYYLVNSSFKFNKLFKLASHYMVYTVCFFLLVRFIGGANVTFGKAIPGLLPFGHFSWFAETYMVMYLFIEYINIFLHNLSKERYKNLLLLVTVVWYIIPTLLIVFGYKMPLNNSNFLLVIYFYSIGAYIKLYCDKKVYKGMGIVFSLCYLVTLVLNVIIYKLSFKYTVFGKNPYLFSEWNSAFVLAMSVSLFLYFKCRNMFYNKYVNIIASCSFGVYLIHDNTLIRRYLWHNLLHVKEYYQSPWFALYAVGIVLAIYVFCTLIDLGRLYLLKLYEIKSFLYKFESIAEKVTDILIMRVVSTFDDLWNRIS